MAFQTNVLVIFQENHWFIWYTYLIIAFGCRIIHRLGRKQKW